MENDRNIPFWRDNRFSAEDKRQILSPSLLSIHHRHLLLSSRIEDPLLSTFNFFLVRFLVLIFLLKRYVAIYFVYSFLTFNIIDSVFCEEPGLLLNLHRVVNFTLMSRLSFDDLQLTRSLVPANAKITLQTGYFQVICPVLVSFGLLMTLLYIRQK